jgi:inner membrane protein
VFSHAGSLNLEFGFDLMMAVTHAAIAAAGVSLILSSSNPWVIGLGILGSQLPDLDTSTSYIGQICFPLSRWLEKRYPHRSVTHCLFATVAIAIVSLSIGWYWGQILPAIALPLGHSLSCFADTFTKQGVQLFYPYPAWAISVSNPRRRLTTGSPTEYWVLAIAVTILVISLHLSGGGGLSQGISRTVGLKAAAVDIYNQQSAYRHVYVEVEGVWSGDRSRADGKYFVLGMEGSEFVITNAQGIYRTNQQMVVSKLTPVLGETATTQVKTLNFNDENPVATLKRLQVEQPNASIYLSGAIAVDAPEDVELGSPGTNQLQTVTLSGNTITFSYHPLEAGLVQLSEQFVTGSLTVKLISPRP